MPGLISIKIKIMTMQKLRFMLQMMIVILAFPVLFITGISYPKVKAEAGNSGKNHSLYVKNLNITRAIMPL
jgi:hypothetical protein